MKFKEIKALETSEVKSKLTELRKELIKLNAQVATGTALKNPGQLKQTKKGIARILNLLHNKESKKETVEVSKKA